MDSIKSKLPSFEKREGGIRNQVSGMLGRDNKKTEPTYAPRPITELRDPSSYGPPPKRRVEPPPSIPGGSSSSSSSDRGRTERVNTPPSYSSRPSPPALPSSSAKKAPPALPPRLPPRSNSSPVSPPPPVGPRPGPSDGFLNQGAVNRLGSSGISVPGFGIGKSSSSSPQQQQSSPSEGTTWAQKQAALKTANDFHKDPSSVSLNDARSAASTMNNFRQRHGEQVAAGARTANSLNHKYGIADRVGGMAGSQQQQQQQQGQESGIQNAIPTALSVPSLPAKKPPPPVPPKRGVRSSSGILPPPVPSGTKPSF